MSRTVTCTRTVKVNLGNYESADLTVTMVDVLDDLDDYQSASRVLEDLVVREMTRQLFALYKARGKSLTVDVIGKRYGLTLP